MIAWCACLLVLTGCATAPPDWQRAEAQPLNTATDDLRAALAQSWAAGNARRWSGRVTAVASQRADVPNAALQLPRVSPDGRWIAFLDQPDNGDRATVNDLITGRNLARVSLWLRAVDDPGPARRIATTGACWPAWSRDGNVLYFIAYDEELGCTLGIHDVRANQTRWKAVGLRHMLMVAPSADGRRVAVVAYDEIPDQAAIFTIDLGTDRATPGPPHLGTQLFPRWIGNDTLLYVQLADDGAWLMRWILGDAVSHQVTKIEAPRSIFDAQNFLASIPDPLAPDLTTFAYYDLMEDRITLAHFTQDTNRSLPRGWRSGAWWGSDWFLAASSDETRLFPAPPGSNSLPGSNSTPGSLSATPASESAKSGIPKTNTANDASLPGALRLIPGRWAPLWSDREKGSILLVGQSDRPDRFVLLQVWLVAGREE